MSYNSKENPMEARTRLLLMLTAAFSLTSAATIATAQLPGIQAYSTNLAPGSDTAYRSSPTNYVPGRFNRSASHLERARAEIDAGNFRQAKRILERRVRFGSDPRPHYLSAVAHSGLGQLDDAHRLFASALAIDGEYVGARVGLALTDIRLGRHGEAAAALALIESQRAQCAGTCAEARDLDRGARLIRHFLDEAPLG